MAAVSLRAVLDGQMSEAQMYAELVKAARVGGWLGFHCHDSRRSPEGFPDWLFLRGGEMLVYECKTARGRLTNDQAIWLAAFRVFADAHALDDWIEVRVVYPTDLSECLKRLLARPGMPPVEVLS